MKFDHEHFPQIGVSQTLCEGLSVVTAPNASPMTFTGTQTYILGETELAIIDPGPDLPAHLEALIRAINARNVSHILVTHSHIDHSPLAKRLSEIVDAPVYGFGPGHAGRSAIMETLAARGGLGGGEGIDHGFSPDILLRNKDRIKGAGWELEAIHTPGHLSNHLCFGWGDNLFSGDHVMGWSTTLVSPPDGDLTQFMVSMKKLQNRPANCYFPGHGAVLHNPHKMLAHQISHRLHRESQVLEGLKNGFVDVASLTRRIYADVDQNLWPVAQRNVLAHMIDLVERNLIRPVGAIGANGQFQLV